MTPATAAAPSAHEALIQFLYQAPIGLLQTAADGDITMLNPTAAALLMPLVEGGDLSNLFDVLAPVAPQLRALALASDGGSDVVCKSLRLVLPAGAATGARTLELSLLRLDADAFMASLNDVTLNVLHEEQRLATQLRNAARVDSLTALPTRAVAVERIASALRAARGDAEHRFAVLFVNCDRFNDVNLTLGPAAGDRLLRLIGERLNGVVRPGDAVARAAATQAPAETTTARLSGDEFVVVLEGLRRADDVAGVAQRLCDALGKPYLLDGTAVHVGVSMGIVLPAHAVASSDADALLQDAGLAMREAKRAGGGRFAVFDPLMKVLAARRASVEGELRDALERGGLFVVYQPIVDLASGRCVGAEALVRWRHPVRGVVPPVEFIEVAEETGLIELLGEFVLDDACSQFVAWQRAFGDAAPQVMSVNLSRAQLVKPTIVDKVRQALARHAMAARHLQLEVTESLAAQDADVQQRLHALKQLGLTLALDDFGTGYSSLASLHLLPVDVVKIDRSFVAQSESSAHHRVLIEATVQVAKSLGMGTVAEGIETEGQAATLTRLRCDKGQGYLFARPMEAAAATAWIARRAGGQLAATGGAGVASQAGVGCTADGTGAATAAAAANQRTAAAHAGVAPAAAAVGAAVASTRAAAAAQPPLPALALVPPATSAPAPPLRPLRSADAPRRVTPRRGTS